MHWIAELIVSATMELAGTTSTMLPHTGSAALTSMSGIFIIQRAQTSETSGLMDSAMFDQDLSQGLTRLGSDGGGRWKVEGGSGLIQVLSPWGS